MGPVTKSAYLSVRLPEETHAQFKARAERFGTPSEVLRELIDAFVEDRVTIRPPVNRKDQLYVSRSQD